MTFCDKLIEQSQHKSMSLTMVWPESCTRTYIGSMWQIESHANLVLSCTDVNMARLRGTFWTVAYRPPTLSVGGISGHDTGSPLLAAGHLLCTAQWLGTLCPTTTTHSRTLRPSNRAWKLGCFLGTSIHSALETFATIALYKSTYPIPIRTCICICVCRHQWAGLYYDWASMQTDSSLVRQRHLELKQLKQAFLSQTRNYSTSTLVDASTTAFWSVSSMLMFP